MPTITVLLPLLRARRRLSQRQLAALANVRPDTISALERGAATGIRFETLARICEALNCGPGELFDVRGDTHTVPTLGGPDEDDLVRARMHEARRRVDGPSFIDELLRRASEPLVAHAS
jgi:putative transcriptional regulator